MTTVEVQDPVCRYRLSTEKIERGMFVMELDRPWLDTPFLLQGLLVESDSEIGILRQHCRFAYVDLARSWPEVAQAIYDAALDAPPERKSTRSPPPAPAASLPDRVSSLGDAATESAGRSSIVDRLLRWLRRGSSPSASRPPEIEIPVIAPAESLALKAARLELPEGLKLQRYEISATIEVELPRARRAWQQSTETLQTLLSELQNDTPVELENVEQAADGLVESMIENPDAMMLVARLRTEHQGTYQHCLKVALYLIALGRHLGFPREDLVRLGLIGMLADVGKTLVPRVLLERHGLLSPAEHDVIKQHVPLGLDALCKSMKLDDKVMQGIAQHHERLDGSGYPRRLAGREIGIFGRMAGIADCFAALVTHRPYAEAQSPQTALMNLYSWAGASFHEPLVEQFVQAIGVFPVGGLVELSNGEAAIVVSHNNVRRLEPRVLVLTGPDKKRLAEPFERNLLNAPDTSEGRSIRVSRGLAAGTYGLNPGDYYAERSASDHDLAVQVA